MSKTKGVTTKVLGMDINSVPRNYRNTLILLILVNKEPSIYMQVQFHFFLSFVSCPVPDYTTAYYVINSQI